MKNAEKNRDYGLRGKSDGRYYISGNSLLISNLVWFEECILNLLYWTRIRNTILLVGQVSNYYADYSSIKLQNRFKFLFKLMNY